ncbi:DUF1800 domain-containing protein [Hymenobacter terrenus]|uniref:DUF1800 domain-containing protein n=1 Tax=Hymenobacter terrenus TaxID=1629124 RepID=UPI000696873D|nr:DUF1800 domain-containing protein [Hymenobacter terrenus]
MDRRTFLRKPATAIAASGPALATGFSANSDPPETVSPFANKALPTTLARVTSTLTPYTGPWGYAQAAHLLRRSTFGPTRAEITTAAGQSLTQVLNRLLTVPAAPAPPVNGFSRDTTVPVGQSWLTTANGPEDYLRRNSLRSWWLNLLLQSTTLVEKMTLLWSSHFVTEIEEVEDARISYDYIALLRRQALGNVKQLAKDITVAPAMLRYLNGNQNRVGAPNENFGRELLELFTVGKGPLIGPGNYTYYTEDDVQAAAKVMTGWRDSNATPDVGSNFTAARHDTTTKQFSSAFGNATIANQGDQEYGALINLIFDQDETATALVRRLYRWFVYYVIDATTERNIIQPLATQLRQNGYNIAPVLRTLLSSEHFFDTLNIGCFIKSPLDFVVGVVRQLEVSFPAATNVVARYGLWQYLTDVATGQQQRLGDPPNVAGWAAYWQTPQYNEIWINAVTLPLRNQFTDNLVRQNGITRNIDGTNHVLKIDVVALVQGFPATTASDCNLLIAEFVKLLLPTPLTANQLAYLNDALLPGLPDFEWTDEWQDFRSTPNDATKRAAVETKLRALLRQIMGMAEFHLS